MIFVLTMTTSPPQYTWPYHTQSNMGGNEAK
jgi:hypothetical protein